MHRVSLSHHLKCFVALIFCDTKAPSLKSNRHITELSLSKTKKQLASIALATKADFGHALLPDETDEIALQTAWEPNFLCLELDSGVHSCANTPVSRQNLPKSTKNQKPGKKPEKCQKSQAAQKQMIFQTPPIFDKRKDTRIPWSGARTCCQATSSLCVLVSLHSTWPGTTNDEMMRWWDHPRPTIRDPQPCLGDLPSLGIFFRCYKKRWKSCKFVKSEMKKKTLFSLIAILGCNCGCANRRCRVCCRSRGCGGDRCRFFTPQIQWIQRVSL